MFPSEMVLVKIVQPSSGPLCECFPRKWYALKLWNPQVVHFVHFSLTNGTPENWRTLKWSTFSMFPSQMVRLKIVESSSGPRCPCFPRKWYALKLSNLQVVHFVHDSLANGTPWNCRTLKWSTLSMFPSQMVRPDIIEPWNSPLCPCFPRKWYALKLSKPQVVHFLHVSNRKWYGLKLSNPQMVHVVHGSLVNGAP